MKSKLNCNDRPMCNITHMSSNIQLLIKVTPSLKYHYFIKIFHRCWRRGDFLGQTKLKVLYISLHQSMFHTLYPHLLQKRIIFLFVFAFDFETRIWQTETRTNRQTTTYIFIDRTSLCSSLFNDRGPTNAVLFSFLKNWNFLTLKW